MPLLSNPQGWSSSFLDSMRGEGDHAAIRKLTLDPPPRDGGSQAGFPGLLERLRWEAADLVPINQEDLAYTLQTFCWVVIRTLRKTGADFLPTETSAFIHAWNVTGHLMGIRAELLPETTGRPTPRRGIDDDGQQRSRFIQAAIVSYRDALAMRGAAGYILLSVSIGKFDG